MARAPDNPSPSPSRESQQRILEEQRLVQALRNRDAQAFAELVEKLHPSLLRWARSYLPRQELAEEVVQETWLGVIRGIDRFEGRSSLRTWIFQILTNRAKTRAVREGRYVSLRPERGRGPENDEPAVDPGRFWGPEHPHLRGEWARPPQSWGQNPEAKLLSKQAVECIEQELSYLPPLQRAVIILRDMEQWTSQEVCNALEITDTYQRVLLHRARSRVRKACEEYIEGLVKK